MRDIQKKVMERGARWIEDVKLSENIRKGNGGLKKAGRKTYRYFEQARIISEAKYRDVVVFDSYLIFFVLWSFSFRFKDDSSVYDVQGYGSCVHLAQG